MLLPAAAPPVMNSQILSTPSATAVHSSSNPFSKKSLKSTCTVCSNKRRQDALDDGLKAHSTARSSFISSDVPTPTPQASNSKYTNATSMITLAGAVASLGTSINHQTMISDHHIADKVQGFINSQNYLSDLEKSLVGEHYALQTTQASRLMKMTPGVAKITLERKAKILMKDIDADMEGMAVGD